MLGSTQRDKCKSLSKRKCNRKYTAGYFSGKGEMVGQEPTSSLVTGWLGKPHPEQGQIGKA